MCAEPIFTDVVERLTESSGMDWTCADTADDARAAWDDPDCLVLLTHRGITEHVGTWAEIEFALESAHFAVIVRH